METIKLSIENMRQYYKPPYYLISRHPIDISEYPEIEKNITCDFTPINTYYLVQKKHYKPFKLS